MGSRDVKDVAGSSDVSVVGESEADAKDGQRRLNACIPKPLAGCHDRRTTQAANVDEWAQLHDRSDPYLDEKTRMARRGK